MDERLNCWEYFGCPKGPGGSDDLCRAARETALDGINGGQNGGRSCWAVVGTMAVDAEPHVDRGRCGRCQFRRLVASEELPDLVDCGQIYERLGYGDILSLSCRVECEAECVQEVTADV